MTTYTKRPGFEREIDTSPGINLLDTNNSSSVVLAAEGVFTGAWVDVSAYSDVVVSVATDQDGSYSIQFSPDGVNADSVINRYYRTSQINVPHRFTVTRAYFRVVYTNGVVDQGYFRLQSHIGSYTSLNSPLDGTLSQDYDSVSVRPSRYENELVLGSRQGQSEFLKFGFNNDVDTGTPEVIASFGGSFTPLTTASTLTFVSNSVEDASAGTGARTLLLSYLDASRNPAVEVITLNGTTSVTSVASCLGINRVVVLSSGSGTTNAGDISITATTGGSNQGYIPVGFGITQQCIYFNPDGYDSLIHQVSFNVLKLSGGGANPEVTVNLKVYNPKVTQSTYTIRRYKLDTAVSSTVTASYPFPIRLDPTDVCWLECLTDTNNTSIDAEMDITQHRRAAG